MVRFGPEPIDVTRRLFRTFRVAVRSLLFATLMTWGCAATFAAGPAQYYRLFQTDFASGTGNLEIQAGRGSMNLVPAPGKPSVKAVRFEINKSDDFSHVSNGSPRAEFSFLPVCTFHQGQEYKITWSCYIPEDYQFDPLQPEILVNIHETLSHEPPPFCMTLMGNLYQVRLQNDQPVYPYTTVGDATHDRGKWVNWMLEYRPDSRGTTSVTKLYKDGKLLFDGKGLPNAFPFYNISYLKIGIYKWWWKERPSDVSRRVIYYGDVAIFVRKE